MLVEDQNRHLYSVYFNSLSQRVVLCGSCAGAFMIMANGKKFVLISRQSSVMMIIKKIRDPESSNLLNINLIKDMRTEWNSRDDIRKE